MTTLVEYAEEKKEYVDAMLESPHWPENPLAKRPFKIKWGNDTREGKLVYNHRIFLGVDIEEDGTTLILKDDDKVVATFDSIEAGMDFICARIKDSLWVYDALLVALDKCGEFFSPENVYFDMCFGFAWGLPTQPARLCFRLTKKTYDDEPERIMIVFCDPEGSHKGEVRYRVEANKDISLEEAVAYMQS